MAEINIQRKKKKTRWPWILLLIVLLIVIAWVVYQYMADPAENPVDQILNSVEKLNGLYAWS